LEGDINNTNTAVGYEKSFYDIDNTKIVDQSQATGITAYQNNNGIANPYPNGNSGNTNVNANSAKLYKLNATANKTGLGITLKVMAGDKIDIFGKSYYFQNNTGDNSSYNLPAIDLINALLGSPEGSITAAHGTVTATDINNVSGGNIGGFLTNSPRTPTTSSTPRAYINYLILDEQFKYVSGGFSSVGSNGIVKDHHSELQNIAITKNGYIFIYCSNESPVNVFFDNLQVAHTRGPLVEETHYYPFGLAMAGISSRALNFGSPENKYKYNDGTELANKEFSDGSGLELYETNFRSLDPQLGRFWQIDPYSSDVPLFSPYVYASNNPILRNDPLGLQDTIVLQNVTVYTGKGFWGKTNLYYNVMDYLKSHNASIDQIVNNNLREMMYRFDAITNFRNAVADKADEDLYWLGAVLGPVALVYLADAGAYELVYQGGQWFIRVAGRNISFTIEKLKTFLLNAGLRTKFQLDRIARYLNKDFYKTLANFFKNNVQNWEKEKIQNILKKGDKIFDIKDKDLKQLYDAYKIIKDFFKLK
jgi:RHS repeat-associated protein